MIESVFELMFSIFTGLLQNISILIAFGVFYSNFWIKNQEDVSLRKKVFSGLIIGLIGMLIMHTPWVLQPGIVFDARSVMLCISGLFFGIIPTLIAIVITAATRILHGGTGVYMGVSVIVTSGVAGILWNKLRPQWKEKNTLYELLFLGTIVHLLMLAYIPMLPYENMIFTFKTIFIPIIFLYIPSTVLLGFLLLKQNNNYINSIAQNKLNQSERRINEILKGNNFIAITLDKNGNLNFCNNFLLYLTGYSKKEIIGKNWFGIFTANDVLDEEKDFFYEIIQQDTYVPNYQNRIITKNKSELYIFWYFTKIFDENDELLGLTAIGINVTELKKYQKEIEESNKKIEIQNQQLLNLNEELKLAVKRAEETDKLKSAFLSNLSHEIRTPMNGILGFVQLIEDFQNSKEDIEEYASYIKKSSERMLKTMNEIIEISKIHSGVIQISKEKVLLDKTIDIVINIIKSEFPNTDVEILFEKDSMIQTEIETDIYKITQILEHLIGNAVKYTLKGYVRIGYTFEDNNLKIIVEDTGIGIPNDKISNIFNIFEQVDLSLNRNHEGIGLGLSLVKAYLEALGGTINVNSEPNIGSKFEVLIPVN